MSALAPGEQGPASRRWEARMRGVRPPMRPDEYGDAIMRARADLAAMGGPVSRTDVLRRARSRLPKRARVGSYVHLSDAWDRSVSL